MTSLQKNYEDDLLIVDPDKIRIIKCDENEVIFKATYQYNPEELIFYGITFDEPYLRNAVQNCFVKWVKEEADQEGKPTLELKETNVHMYRIRGYKTMCGGFHREELRDKCELVFYKLFSLPNWVTHTAKGHINKIIIYLSQEQYNTRQHQIEGPEMRDESFMEKMKLFKFVMLPRNKVDPFLSWGIFG